jgi:6-phosphofructokinase 1
MKIGILTSGGDAPGMNAAIRAVVRKALVNNCKVYGIKRGYAGILSGEIIQMNSRTVGDILQRGGTVLNQPVVRSLRPLKAKLRQKSSLTRWV